MGCCLIFSGLRRTKGMGRPHILPAERETRITAVNADHVTPHSLNAYRFSAPRCRFIYHIPRLSRIHNFKSNNTSSHNSPAVTGLAGWRVSPAFSSWRSTQPHSRTPVKTGWDSACINFAPRKLVRPAHVRKENVIFHTSPFQRGQG